MVWPGRVSRRAFLGSASALGGLILARPRLAWAQPSITSRSGTFTSGQSNTLTGTGFGTKGGTNANKPLIWADFEASIDPTSLGHLTAWSENTNLVLNSGAPQYGLSAQNVVGTWSPGVASFSFGRVHSVSTLYIAARRYYDFTMTANQKFFRIFSSGSGDMVASTSNGGICFDEICTTQAGRFDGFTPIANAWQKEEFLWRKATTQDCGGTNIGDGYYEWIRDGVREQGLIDTLISELAATYGQGTGIRILDNFTDSGNLPPDGSKVYMDDLYVDDTWARVVLGNASTLSASTVREVQIPSAWSATSITITVNEGSLTSGDRWLYVIDSSNVASAGFLITTVSGPGRPPVVDRPPVFDRPPVVDRPGASSRPSVD